MPLSSFATALDELRAPDANVAAICERLRATPLPGGLPPKFAEVLDQILSRLESSALFDAESCSFSRGDLLDALQAWLDKARQRTA